MSLQPNDLDEFAALYFRYINAKRAYQEAEDALETFEATHYT